MKKTAVIFTLIITLVLSCISVQANFGIKLFVNGNEVTTEVAPMIVNDRTMVPARVVFEHLGGEVSWLEASRQVVITSGIQYLYSK